MQAISEYEFLVVMFCLHAVELIQCFRTRTCVRHASSQVSEPPRQRYCKCFHVHGRHRSFESARNLDINLNEVRLDRACLAVEVPALTRLEVPHFDLSGLFAAIGTWQSISVDLGDNHVGLILFADAAV